jgi:hypothetical protein
MHNYKSVCCAALFSLPFHRSMRSPCYYYLLQKIKTHCIQFSIIDIFPLSFFRKIRQVIKKLKYWFNTHTHSDCVVISCGRVIAQAVSRWLPTVAAQVRTQVRSCGIRGGQSGTGAGFLRVLRSPLPILIPLAAPHLS